MRCGVRRQRGRTKAINSSYSAPHLPKRDMSTDRSAPFQPCLIPEAGFSSLLMVHQALQIAKSVRKWVAARRVDPPVEFSHSGAVYPCVSVSSNVGLDAKDGTMSLLEDYVADILSTLIQRKVKIPGSVLEKALVCLTHVEAREAVQWRGKSNATSRIMPNS